MVANVSYVTHCETLPTAANAPYVIFVKHSNDSHIPYAVHIVKPYQRQPMFLM
jgi:hypothetical protein